MRCGWLCHIRASCCAENHETPWLSARLGGPARKNSDWCLRKLENSSNQVQTRYQERNDQGRPPSSRLCKGPASPLAPSYPRTQRHDRRPRPPARFQRTPPASAEPAPAHGLTRFPVRASCSAPTTGLRAIATARSRRCRIASRTHRRRCRTRPIRIRSLSASVAGAIIQTTATRMSNPTGSPADPRSQ